MIEQVIPAPILEFLTNLNTVGEFWLVGGCVRDALMGRTPKDFDFVTTTPECGVLDMYQRIGKDFPVWQTSAGGFTVEIASARTERKVGPGHGGFVTEVTRSLEEDLMRRDLTINAIAWRPGDFRDPQGGCFDLENMCLRHVSPAFAEDPLRVFRVARFAAQLGFHVDGRTIELMRSLRDELVTLPKDRVREELMKALRAPYPDSFFRVLIQADCLKQWFPEVAMMDGCTQSEVHHPEGDVFEHTCQVILRARELGGDDVQMLCALGHDFGKPAVRADRPSDFHGHEEAGAAPIIRFCERLGFGEQTRRAMITVALHHLHLHRVFELRPGTLLKMFKQVGRGALGVRGFALVCQADHQGRGSINWDSPYPQRYFFLLAFEVHKSIKFVEGWNRHQFEEAQTGCIRRFKTNYPCE